MIPLCSLKEKVLKLPQKKFLSHDFFLFEKFIFLCLKKFQTKCYLGSTRKEAGNVDKGNEGNIEGIAEANKATGLDGGVDVEAAGGDLGLVGDDADGAAVHARHADHDVLGVIWLDLPELAIVNQWVDNVLHVVGSG